MQTSGERARFTETPLEDWVFSPDYAIPLVENQFGVLSLEGFGLEGKPAAATAAGAILHYVRSTQKGTLQHVDRIGFYDRQEYLVLDAVTVRNLELVEPLFANTGMKSRSSARLTPRSTHGQKASPRMDVAAIHQCGEINTVLTPGSRRKRLCCARRIAARARWRHGHGAPAQPRDSGNGQPA